MSFACKKQIIFSTLYLTLKWVFKNLTSSTEQSTVYCLQGSPGHNSKKGVNDVLTKSKSWEEIFKYFSLQREKKFSLPIKIMTVIFLHSNFPVPMPVVSKCPKLASTTFIILNVHLTPQSLSLWSGILLSRIAPRHYLKCDDVFILYQDTLWKNRADLGHYKDTTSLYNW